MRNHHEKARDMARSVLPSTRRRGARFARAQAHRRERSRVRAALHDLATYDDPDDFEDDLTWEARGDIDEMVWERRAADKLGPLLRWAERTVDRDPSLSDASYEERKDHFRRLLPEGLIGRHALVHLRWVLDDEVPWWRRRATEAPAAGPTAHEKVEAIVAAGRHGELNRRIRHVAPGFAVRRVHVPARRLIDDTHAEPGVLVSARTAEVREPVRPRLLLGAHDVEAFVKEGELEPVHELYAELTRDGLI